MSEETKMIQVKYATLTSSVFAVALSKLLNESEIPTSAKFKLLTLKRKIDTALRDYEELRKKLVDKYAEKDDKGAFVFVDEKKQAIKLVPETIEEFSKSMQEMLETCVELKPIPMQELGDKFSLSVMDIDALGELLP